MTHVNHVYIYIFVNVWTCKKVWDIIWELIPPLTHWGRATLTCVGNLNIIGSDNGLSPGRRQAIFWTNAGILLIGPWGTNFSEILIGIQTFSLKKMHLKMASAKWRPFCLGLNVLTHRGLMMYVSMDWAITCSSNGSLPCSAPIHYPNNYSVVVKWNLESKFQEDFNQSVGIIIKCWTFCSGLNMLKMCNLHSSAPSTPRKAY